MQYRFGFETEWTFFNQNYGNESKKVSATLFMLMAGVSFHEEEKKSLFEKEKKKDI